MSFDPSEPSTPAARAVLVYLAVVVLATMGAVALHYAGSTDNPKVAAQLAKIGYGALGLAGVIVAVRLAVVAIMDRL